MQEIFFPSSFSSSTPLPQTFIAENRLRSWLDKVSRLFQALDMDNRHHLR
jgi:hypothetical protein